MIKQKVDPRTGTIYKGIPPRRSMRSTIPQDNASRYRGQMVFPEQALLQMLSSFKDMAKDIGKTIASEMNKNTKVQQPPYILQMNSSGQQAVKENDTFISIDESIADVGIEDKNDFQKGKHSASLSKEEVQPDEDLSRSKNKLQALKKKK